jgi:putative hemolysin
MIHASTLVLSAIGLMLAAIAGFGNHLLVHFRGRTLEAYCRLKGDKDRFGQILDGQKDSQVACGYLFIFGSSVALIAGGMWLTSLLQSGLGTGAASSISVLQLASYSVIAAIVLSCLYSWLPKIVVQNGAAVLLFHTWWWWKMVTLFSRPFRTLEYLFIALGHRLSDKRSIDRAEEESLEDEIRKMILIGERDGLVTRSMREMVTGVMNLDEGQVSQIMTPRSKVDAIDIDWNWTQVLSAITQSGRTRMPVYEGSLDTVVGVLFVKDLMALLQKEDRPSSTHDIKPMLREAWMIPATRQTDELLKDFLLRRSHMAIVVDEFQQTLGVVTIEDALEEIVGEIADELDVDETLPMLIEDPDGSFSIAGAMEVAAVNRQLSLDLPESDDYETVAGMMIAILGTIPKVGTKAKIQKLQFAVTQANARQVQRIRIGLTPTKK